MMVLSFKIERMFNKTQGSLFWGISWSMADSCHKRKDVSSVVGLNDLGGLG